MSFIVLLYLSLAHSWVVSLDGNFSRHFSRCQWIMVRRHFIERQIVSELVSLSQESLGKSELSKIWTYAFLRALQQNLVVESDVGGPPSRSLETGQGRDLVTSFALQQEDQEFLKLELKAKIQTWIQILRQLDISSTDQFVNWVV